MSRDWQKDKRYLQELNNWEMDPDDEDLYKIATHWLQQYAELKEECDEYKSLAESLNADIRIANEEIARINCDYYADKQRFVVQRRKLAELEAREQKLREAIQTVIEMKELNPEQMATDQKGLYDAAMWFLSGIMDSLYPKEETKP